MTDTNDVLVAKEEVGNFIVRCVKTVGVPQNHADRLADNLVCADYRGHFTHGLNRTNFYVQDFRNGTIKIDGEPEILKETPCSAWVDGKNLPGHSTAAFCMEIAIKKAKEIGIGWVSAKGCTHFGIAGYYSLMAEKEGLVGIAMSNSPAVLLPTRSREGCLGANPLSIASPANGDSFVLDMACSSVCVGTVELAALKNIVIPKTWGCDKNGKPCDNPATVFEARRLFPLGGAEITSGYKGYGLAMMVEVFCGIMSGSLFGADVNRLCDMGQCFVALDPNLFAPGFEDRMSTLLDMCRNLEPAEGETSVLVAGDKARQAMKRCDEEGGIRYHHTVIDAMDKVADDLGVERLKRLE